MQSADNPSSVIRIRRISLVTDIRETDNASSGYPNGSIRMIREMINGYPTDIRRIIRADDKRISGYPSDIRFFLKKIFFF